MWMYVKKMYLLLLASLQKKMQRQWKIICDYILDIIDYPCDHESNTDHSVEANLIYNPRGC